MVLFSCSLIIDQERKVLEFGPANWHKVCYLPTKSDAALSGYRRWLIKYSQGQVEWNTRFSGTSLPPTPSREILMDRYVYLTTRLQTSMIFRLALSEYNNVSGIGLMW